MPGLRVMEPDNKLLIFFFRLALISPFKLEASSGLENREEEARNCTGLGLSPSRFKKGRGSFSCTVSVSFDLVDSQVTLLRLSCYNSSGLSSDHTCPMQHSVSIRPDCDAAPSVSCVGILLSLDLSPVLLFLPV